VLLSTSPRVAPGLLSAEAWTLLRAGRVLARTPDHPQLPHLDAAGILVEIDADPAHEALAQRLVSLAQAETIVWLLGGGDDPLVLAVHDVIRSLAEPPELTLLAGSHDLPGSRLLDLVALMDRLRSPGGCPWDARQTHESLLTYLVEETYETVEAIESGDLGHLREELGDLLLQVVFHARIAEEHPDSGWSIDDVAGAIVDKLVRRHPHVFESTTGTGPETTDVQSADDLETTWERLKATEKGRASATDGIPPGLPALSLAGKLMSRAQRSGLDVQLPVDGSIGGRLLALVAEAQQTGVDPESELRRYVRLYRQVILTGEERR
jgi:XTP/dITP diphosphohydrolase